MKTLCRVWAALFLLLLWLPLIEQQCHVFPAVRLYGVERPGRPAQFTWRGWWTGDFQRDFERRLARRIGLRGYLVKTFNEFRYTLFGETHARGGTQIVIGRDGWLYDRNQVQRYGRPARSTPEQRSRIVADLRRLQDALAARGIAFCVILAPTKPTLYPEFVLPELLPPPKTRGPGEYEQILPLLRVAGVHTVDGMELLARRKQEQPHPLFPRTGTHWNYLAAGYVVEELTVELRRQSGRDFPVIRPVAVTVDRTPEGTDNDLGQLLNIWRTEAIAGPQVHPSFAREGGGEAHRPNILFIGDSFVHTLTHVLDRMEYYRARDTFYYFRRRFTYPGGGDEPLDGSRFDWRRELLERDAVVIEICEHWLPNIGFGFVASALAFLDGDTAAELRAEGTPDDD